LIARTRRKPRPSSKPRRRPAAHRAPADPRTLPPARAWDRRPAAVPFLLGALARYEVLERDDWNTLLAGGILGKDQVEHVRRSAYEGLLWLADDVVRRRQEHRSGRLLSPQAAARAAFAYLGKAANARVPTLAFYVLRARCRKVLGEGAAAQADRQRAARMSPAVALDHYLQGQEAYDARQFAAAIGAFESALRLEPTHYWSMLRRGACLYELGQSAEDFVGALRIFSGCILKRPDHAHAYFHRGNTYYKLRRKHEAVRLVQPGQASRRPGPMGQGRRRLLHVHRAGAA
jgi:tetratricopeptide (TPR) repeat protein